MLFNIQKLLNSSMFQVNMYTDIRYIETCAHAPYPEPANNSQRLAPSQDKRVSSSSDQGNIYTEKQLAKPPYNGQKTNDLSKHPITNNNKYPRSNCPHLLVKLKQHQHIHQTTPHRKKTDRSHEPECIFLKLTYKKGSYRTMKSEQEMLDRIKSHSCRTLSLDT